jgi:hypothetical protein
MTDQLNASTVGSWAARIKAEVGKTVNSVLAIGRLLIAAKTALDHGMFEVMFFDLPFDLRMGEMYMRIATNEVLANAKHVSLFPSAVSTLYQLSRIPLDDLEAAILDGRIHPRLQRDDVHTLFTPLPAMIEWSLDVAEERLTQAINREIDGATPAAAHQVIDLLRRLTDKLEHTASPEIQDAVTNAREDLERHDAEPGGCRFYESDREAALHPGAPAVIGGVKSTHAEWYRQLTTGEDGVTSLRREEVDRRLSDIEALRLPTKQTMRTYEAVWWALGLYRYGSMTQGASQR